MTAAEGWTPGPWERVDTADYAEIRSTTRPGPPAIALVGRPADADLIAAAPDLLEAWVAWFDATERLRELEANCDTTKRFDAALMDQERAEEAARAAIARAQGGAA